MLERLNLSNVALFKEQTIDFGLGFNSLIGETGAGKSIIIDALSFVIGENSDKLLIRNDCDFVKVEALFTNLTNQTLSLLEKYGIEIEDCLIVSRTLTKSGRNDIRINGSMVTISMLKEIGQTLISIYGQHENLLLLNDKNHQSILDSFDAKKIDNIKSQIGSYLNQYDSLCDKISQLGGNREDREREIDILKFQIDEIAKAKLEIGEDEKLKKDIDKMSSFEKIIESLNVVTNLIDANSFSVLDNLRQSSKQLYSIEKYDENFGKLANRLEECNIEIDDILQTIEEEKRQSFYDDRILEQMIERDQQIKKFKKKYGSTIEEILDFCDKAKQKINQYENADFEISRLEKEKQSVSDLCYKKCVELTSLRTEIAGIIEKGVEKELKDLGMKNTKFKVDISSKCDEFNRKNISQSGKDNVKFLFSANLGQDLKSLSKTISGGEMSRFMLAVKNVLNSDEGLLVFDEVDAGISGQIAVQVAQKLARISIKNQILCISHLPQVSSMADNFYKVEKFVDSNQTYSKVYKVSGQDINNEIAAMAYGENLTENAFEYANDLIKKNRDFKNSINE